eukprot:TRINITY_DN42709_c0_g1_i1.p1 TRINITY_DN42709_c0_g1~~TRINITY_DN42709_c0_g1_i1.p1  ORF type:complete len:590 (-),score=140.02 TRINITY_DN42709_c0_g1_i1:78-1847(-)
MEYDEMYTSRMRNMTLEEQSDIFMDEDQTVAETSINGDTQFHDNDSMEALSPVSDHHHHHQHQHHHHQHVPRSQSQNLVMNNNGQRSQRQFKSNLGNNPASVLGTSAPSAVQFPNRGQSRVHFATSSTVLGPSGNNNHRSSMLDDFNSRAAPSQPVSLMKRSATSPMALNTLDHQSFAPGNIPNITSQRFSHVPRNTSFSYIDRDSYIAAHSIQLAGGTQQPPTGSRQLSASFTSGNVCNPGVPAAGSSSRRDSFSSTDSNVNFITRSVHFKPMDHASGLSYPQGPSLSSSPSTVSLSQSLSGVGGENILPASKVSRVQVLGSSSSAPNVSNSVSDVTSMRRTKSSPMELASLDNEVDTRSSKRLVRKAEAARQSRRRKKAYIESLEEKFARLSARLAELEAGPDQARSLLQEAQRNEQKAIRERLDEILASQQPDSHMDEIRDLLFAYIRNGRKKQNTAEYYLGRCDTALTPSLQLKFAMWGLSQTDDFYDQPGIWRTIMMDEIGLSEQQLQEMKQFREAVQQTRSCLQGVCARLKKLKEGVRNHISVRERHMDELAQSVNPLQVAKFCAWVEKNPLCMQMLNTVWKI